MTSDDKLAVAIIALAFVTSMFLVFVIGLAIGVSL